MKIIIIKLSFLICSVLLLTSCNSVSIQQKTAANNSANLNVELGLAYLKQNNLSLAKEKLLRAIEIAPQNYLANDAYAYFLEKNADSKTAEKYYIKAIKFADAKNKGAAYNNYGTFLYRQKRYNEALKYFLLAANDPNYLNFAIAKKNITKVKNKIFKS